MRSRPYSFGYYNIVCKEFVMSQKNFSNCIFTGCHNLPLKWNEENRLNSFEFILVSEKR